MACRKVVRGKLFEPGTIPGQPVFGEVSYECSSPNMRSFTTRNAFYSTIPDARILETSQRRLLTLPRHLRRLNEAATIEGAGEAPGEDPREDIGEDLGEDLEDREEEQLAERLTQLEQEAGSIREYLSRRGRASRYPSRGGRHATLWSAQSWDAWMVSNLPILSE